MSSYQAYRNGNPLRDGDVLHLKSGDKVFYRSATRAGTIVAYKGRQELAYSIDDFTDRLEIKSA